MLRRIRKNPFINRIVRNALKALGGKPGSFFGAISNRWGVSGVVECIFNDTKLKLYGECDDRIVNGLFYNRKYTEAADLTLFMILAANSKVIVDIGANIGLFSILSSKASPNAKVFPIEPYQPNYTRLLKNIGLNELGNVFPQQIAMGSAPGTLDLYVPINNSITDAASANGSFSESIYPDVKWKSVTVKVSSVNDFANEINATIELIKCDVETYEIAVFKGADKVLREHKPIILFETFLDDTRITFFNTVLKEYNYYAYLIREDGIERLDDGIKNKNYNGLNFLISPIKSTKPYLLFSEIKENPGEILLRRDNT